MLILAVKDNIMAFKMKKPLFNGTNQHKKELKNTPLKQKDKSVLDKVSSLQKKENMLNTQLNLHLLHLVQLEPQRLLS